MPELGDKVGASHEFHDREYVQGWAERFTSTPGRLALFDAILGELEPRLAKGGRIVELGLGPGFLADHLLRSLVAVDYVGLDFSAPMLEIARGRLSGFAPRVTFVQADLVNEDWTAKIEGDVDAVVSTWALHDLGSQENVRRVYEKCAEVLGGSGILLNADFIKPDGTKRVFEPGRFEISRHLQMMRQVGFGAPDCITPVLEEESETPDASQNYVCMRAIVSV